MQAAAEAKRNKKKQDQADAESEHSIEGAGPGGAAKAGDTKKRGKIAFLADNQGDAAVEVSVRQGPGGKVWHSAVQVNCVVLAHHLGGPAASKTRFSTHVL